MLAVLAKGYGHGGGNNHIEAISPAVSQRSALSDKSLVGAIKQLGFLPPSAFYSLK